MKRIDDRMPLRAPDAATITLPGPALKMSGIIVASQGVHSMFEVIGVSSLFR
ncbi:hypothetical protein KUV51_18900 [Tateyamaria omphalii]|uniref:hypothetical protein n=1 Tax=Tateyamaria omphalii TaxID=299262 RepID=UPI001C99D9F4|nr:hypothetical protein [Tateyamaria omphalii]MBY5935081.1 hypothetical protein [Tateyamaria omphalii]